MSERTSDPLEALAGGLIVSSQALPGDPFEDVAILTAMARSAELGGAVGLRIARVDVVAAVRAACTVPIIGITKHPDRTRAYITPTLADARGLLSAGADIVASDATTRERPGGLTASEHIRMLKGELGVLVMADVGTVEEGEAAFAAGADLVATTLAGYRLGAASPEGPDLAIVEQLAGLGRVVAEGRIRTPEQLAAAFEAGAYAVVVGRAITRPQDITARFVALTPRARRGRLARPFGVVDAPASPSLVREERPAGRRYWLGVDGGMTGLRASIVSSDGHIHGTGNADSAGLVSRPGGKEALAASLSVAIRGAMGVRTVPLEAAFLALSGVVAGGRLEGAVRDAAAGVVPTDRLYVDHDLRACQAGAFGLRPGLVAYAGTGSAVYGVDVHGRGERAGGLGYLFGDEAGAFGIAREAVRVALRQRDDGVATSPLIDVVCEHVGVRDIGEVPKAFYAGEIDRGVIAGLTRRLARLGEAGDDAASSVFAAAGRHLAGQLVQVARRLDWDDDLVPWAPVGGVFAAGRLILDPMDQRLAHEGAPRFRRVDPILPSSVGAALLAAQLSSDDRDIAGALVPALMVTARGPRPDEGVG